MDETTSRLLKRYLRVAEDISHSLPSVAHQRLFAAATAGWTLTTDSPEVNAALDRFAELVEGDAEVTPLWEDMEDAQKDAYTPTSIGHRCSRKAVIHEVR